MLWYWSNAHSPAKNLADILWLFNIAMGNGPFIIDVHRCTYIKNGDFPWRTVDVITRWYLRFTTISPGIPRATGAVWWPWVTSAPTCGFDRFFGVREGLSFGKSEDGDFIIPIGSMVLVYMLT